MNRLNYFIATVFLLAIGSFAMAEDIQIRDTNSPAKMRDEIPVTVDYDKEVGELLFEFYDDSDYRIEVYSSSGATYAGRAGSSGSVRVDLAQTVGESYTVIITDSEGNTYVGEFSI